MNLAIKDRPLPDELYGIPRYSGDTIPIISFPLNWYCVPGIPKHGAQVEVLEPKWLRDKVKKEINKMTKKYCT